MSELPESIRSSGYGAAASNVHGSPKGFLKDWTRKYADEPEQIQSSYREALENRCQSKMGADEAGLFEAGSVLACLYREELHPLLVFIS